jgi:hypothetical protein
MVDNTFEGQVTDEVVETLRTGLRWLYETEQLDGALLTHHGESLPAIAAVNRQFEFVPQAWNSYPVIVVAVVDVRQVQRGPDMVPGNPIRKTELTELAQALTDLGQHVVETWNGHPGTSGSLALRGPAQPTLLAAVARYRAGCPDHPEKRVFCGCGWFQRGYSRVVRPEAGRARGMATTAAGVPVQPPGGQP